VAIQPQHRDAQFVAEQLPEVWTDVLAEGRRASVILGRTLAWKSWSR
jgi:hypothetical protein